MRPDCVEEDENKHMQTAWMVLDGHHLKLSYQPLRPKSFQLPRSSRTMARQIFSEVRTQHGYARGRIIRAIKTVIYTSNSGISYKLWIVATIIGGMVYTSLAENMGCSL